MCPRELVDYPSENFDLDLFKRIIDEVKSDTELIFPWGLGEPLLNPDVFSMIRYCRDAGLYTVLSTNATLLNKDRGRLLMEAGLNNLIIAFDGTTPDVYEKYRKNADFVKVKANVLRFLELKLELAAELFVVLQMIRLPENGHQIRDFHEMWSIPGVDEIRIKEDEVVIPGVAVEDRVNHGRRRNPCYQLWQGPAHINCQGEFRPCCHMYNTEAIGDVNRTSIHELWNSDKMQDLRSAHLRGDLSAYPDCANCHAPNPRYPSILASFLVDVERMREWIPKAERLAIFYRLPIFRDR
jgi:radical SAM protein with 4Fe4S-binding SPASM domain